MWNALKVQYPCLSVCNYPYTISHIIYHQKGPLPGRQIVNILQWSSAANRVNYLKTGAIAYTSASASKVSTFSLKMSSPQRVNGEEFLLALVSLKCISNWLNALTTLNILVSAMRLKILSAISPHGQWKLALYGRRGGLQACKMGCI